MGLWKNATKVYFVDYQPLFFFVEKNVYLAWEHVLLISKITLSAFLPLIGLFLTFSSSMIFWLTSSNAIAIWPPTELTVPKPGEL